MLATTCERSKQTSWDLEDASTLSNLGARTDDVGDRPALAEPERRLLLAVLVDAIVRFQRLASAPPGVRRRELLEAERWIRSDDHVWPCSFVNVCEALDLAHAPLRRALLRWRAAAVSGRRTTRRKLLDGFAREEPGARASTPSAAHRCAYPPTAGRTDTGRFE